MDLRGASAEALVALTERLDDEIGTNQSAAALGDELFTVSQLFRSEAGLRRFATDASLAARGQAGHGPAGVQGPACRRRRSTCSTDAVGRRWTLSRDLPDVLERLSEIAVVRSAGAKAGQVTDELFELSGHRRRQPAAARRAQSTPAARSTTRQRCSTRCSTARPSRPRSPWPSRSLAGTYRTVTSGPRDVPPGGRRDAGRDRGHGPGRPAAAPTPTSSASPRC